MERKNRGKWEGGELKGLPEELKELKPDLLRGLAGVVGKYGKAGGTLGMEGFRMTFPGPKPIDIISVVKPDHLILTLSIAGDIPDQEGTATFRSGSPDNDELPNILVQWDKRISLEDVEQIIANWRNKEN